MLYFTYYMTNPIDTNPSPDENNLPFENPFSEDNIYTRNISKKADNIFSYVYAVVFGLFVGFFSIFFYVYYHEDASARTILEILIGVFIVSGILFFRLRQRFKSQMNWFAYIFLAVLLGIPQLVELFTRIYERFVS